MPQRHVVLISEHLSEQALLWLEKKCSVVCCSYEDPEFDAHLRLAQALIVRTYTRVDATMLAKGGALKVVGRAGAGLDNIDLVACRERSVEVVYRPEANTQAVVEYVVCLLGDALRPRAVLNEAVDQEAWSKLRADTVGRKQFNELTLGILGLGRIGKRLAQVATAIGCEVIYHDLLEIPVEKRHGARPVSLDSLFESSDVLSLHVDGRPGNRNVVGGNELEKMKRDAIRQYVPWIRCG